MTNSVDYKELSGKIGVVKLIIKRNLIKKNRDKMWVSLFIIKFTRFVMNRSIGIEPMTFSFEDYSSVHWAKSERTRV